MTKPKEAPRQMVSVDYEILKQYVDGDRSFLVEDYFSRLLIKNRPSEQDTFLRNFMKKEPTLANQNEYYNRIAQYGREIYYDLQPNGQERSNGLYWLPRRWNDQNVTWDHTKSFKSLYDLIQYLEKEYPKR